MEISLDHRDLCTVVSITGSIDALTAPELVSAMNDLIAQGRTRLVADFGDVDYISSAALRAILGAIKDTRQREGDLRLTGVRSNVRKVLDLSGFTSILKLYPDVDSAAASFAA
jgi:anti-anti-sigma factor